MDRILIIMKKNNGHQGIICPFTGAFFHNMQTCLLVYTYNRSQVSVYRTIGPLVKNPSKIFLLMKFNYFCVFMICWTTMIILEAKFYLIILSIVLFREKC